MPFQKGKPKTGGKIKGQKNKNTLILETFAESIITGGMEKFQEELNKLSGKPYIDAYSSFFEYVKPKLARTELTTPPNDPFVIEVIREDAGASGKA